MEQFKVNNLTGRKLKVTFGISKEKKVKRFPLEPTVILEVSVAFLKNGKVAPLTIFIDDEKGYKNEEKMSVNYKECSLGFRSVRGSRA